MGTPAGETYEVRGRELELSYDSAAHTLTISSTDIGEWFSDGVDPQTALLDLGVYTRVRSLIEQSADSVTVALKPAASVELRASADEGSRLVKRPVSNQFDGSTITKRRNKYGYTATAPMEMLEEIGLEHQQPATVYPTVDDGNLALRVEPTDGPHSMVTRIDSTGLIGIPNGVASAADLDGHGVEWHVVSDNALYGVTTAELEELSFVGRDDGADTTLSGVQQENVEHEGKSWSQEHFKCYLRAQHVETLGWSKDMHVDIHLVSVDGQLGMKLTDDVRDRYVEVDGEGDVVSTAPCVRRCYETENNQLNFYMPNGLVHSMGLANERVYWVVENDALYGCEFRKVFDDIVPDAGVDE